MKKLLFSLLSLGTLNNTLAQLYWQQEAHYEINIDFNTEVHQFEGNQKITYINHSPDTLKKVFFHLYFNAFQPGSMMDVRSRSILDPDKRVGDRISKLHPDEIGIQIIRKAFQNGQALKFSHEETILEINLIDLILPGDTSIFEMDFFTQVPIQIRRSGRMNKEGIDYSMSQWYPKMCEYDKEGWHSNPYVGREFYGVWGSFDVRIQIDPRYTIAATGILQNPNEIGHGYSNVNLPKTKKLNWHFKAENVHDFVWAADPDYIHETITNEEGPDFHFFYQEGEKTKEWKNLAPYMIKTFSYANKHFGKYPYEHYSIIQGGDGGMEYPMATLITGHRTLKSLVGVCVHEAMHSWYQGLIATNEALFAWMDEGFTSYASNRIENELFPENFIEIHRVAYKNYKRIANSDYEESLCTHADHFNTNWAYGTAAYSKGVVFLDQLSHIIGQEVLDRSLRRYYYEWAYKHPNANDFKRIVEKESDIELDWYFEYFVNTTKTIDYGIQEIIGTDLNTQIILKKLEMPMPIEIEVKLKNGQEIKYYIPTVLMRGKKIVNQEVQILDDWPWTHPLYKINVNHLPSNISTITLHKEKHIADLQKLNDVINLPENWDWEKYKLRLEIIKKKNKPPMQKLIKLKK